MSSYDGLTSNMTAVFLKHPLFFRAMQSCSIIEPRCNYLSYETAGQWKVIPTAELFDDTLSQHFRKTDLFGQWLARHNIQSIDVSTQKLVKYGMCFFFFFFFFYKSRSVFFNFQES